MKSLHFKLLWRYAALILSIIIIFMVFLYFIWGNTLRANATGELLADCDNICTLLDTELDQLDQLSKRIVSSNQLQALFVKDIYSDTAGAYYGRMAFSDTLFEIIRLSFNHMELNMFDVSGRYVHVGMTSSFEKRTESPLDVVPWGQQVLDAYGKKVILPAHFPELNTTDEAMISLCRAFSPENPTRETAILELQLQYPYICQRIEDAIHNEKEKKKIFVYNQEQELIYPYGETIPEQTKTYIADVLTHPESYTDMPSTARTLENKPVLFTHKTSDFTKWTVFVAESEEDLFFSFYQFRTLIIAVTLVVLLLTLFITNQIATSVSAPLQKLEQYARTLTLDNLDTFELPKYKNSFRELTSLYCSFGQMKSNLQKSLKDVVSAHTMAVDAQMLALQSQMNPHFLYNTLASISILAEEGDDAKISQVCDDLSLLLRYISSGSARNVKLEQEIEHTVSYINLIKIKYEERIQFHLDIDSSLMSLQVPKLIVQPLVENCVKYGLEVDPPWVITISGYIQNSFWMIQVQDTGSGFSPEYLDEFYQKSAGLKADNPISDLNINGLGLMNLYIRLHLLYKDQMVFKLENPPEGGARVTIGGPLPAEINNGGTYHEV